MKTIESYAELMALPEGSVILVERAGEPPYQITRVEDGSGATVRGYGLYGGKDWHNVWAWGETITVLWDPAKEG